MTGLLPISARLGFGQKIFRYIKNRFAINQFNISSFYLKFSNNKYIEGVSRLKNDSVLLFLPQEKIENSPGGNFSSAPVLALLENVTRVGILLAQYHDSKFGTSPINRCEIVPVEKRYWITTALLKVRY